MENKILNRLNYLDTSCEAIPTCYEIDLKDSEHFHKSGISRTKNDEKVQTKSTVIPARLESDIKESTVNSLPRMTGDNKIDQGTVIPACLESDTIESGITSFPKMTGEQKVKQKKKIIRNKEKGIQKVRFIIQSLFVSLCIWIGIEFYLFTQYLETNGAAAFHSRPPGVDGFLPISSFMSFYLFLTTGEIHSAHPAGFFIFFAIILMSLVFGKSFCSWFCPIGFISELIGDFGEKIFKRRLKLPKWLDYPLRSLKYLLLAFLVYSVVFLMTGLALRSFLDSPYNLVSDVKMYYFFANISQTALIVIAVLFVLSIFIRSFWCRFLCPYGALLGIFSLLSPNKIKRNAVSCIDCGLCNKACPSFIKVDSVKTVISDECSTCLNCADVCPVKDTLELRSILPGKKKVNQKYVAIGVVSIFMIVTGFAMLSGNWQNNVSKEEYLMHYKYMNSYGHPTGTKEFKKLNKEAEIQHKEKINSNSN